VLGVQLETQKLETLADAFTHGGGVFSDSGGEDQRVEPTEHGGERSHGLAREVAKQGDGVDGAWIVRFLERPGADGQDRLAPTSPGPSAGRCQDVRRAMRASTVHDAMPDSVRSGLRPMKFQPFKKRARRRLVVVKIDGSVEDRDSIAVDDPHLTARSTDPLDLDREHQPLGPIDVVNGRLQARGTRIDRQDSYPVGVRHTSLY
jgi:hypothetical protein